MTKLFGPWALAAVTFAMAPQVVRAYDIPFQGSFVVAYSATLNTRDAAYCGGSALPVSVEAHGDGFSTLGALSFSLQKTLGGGLLHGCLTLSTPEGDSLTAIYDGTEGAANANNFVVQAGGTLTFTGGTGRFNGATGTAKFTAVFDNFYPGSSFAGGSGSTPLQGVAFYLVIGKVSLSWLG
jgi:hypothetical protein